MAALAQSSSLSTLRIFSSSVASYKNAASNCNSLSLANLPAFSGQQNSLHKGVAKFREEPFRAAKKLRPKFPNVVMGLQDGTDLNFTDDDVAYSLASIVDAVEVRSGRDGFVVKMADGRHVTCRHSSSDSGPMAESGPQSAIVLRLEDGSDVMLPIIVLEQPAQILMEALKNVPLTRPTVYQVMKDMIGFMGYEIRAVRITHRVCEAYHARAYLRKVGESDSATISLDMRPSDAINLAIRAKVPIQVNKALAVGDGVIPIAVPAMKLLGTVFKMTEADRAEDAPCVAAEEFSLVRSIAVAAMLERYSEAARLRDQLHQFRNLHMEMQKQPSSSFPLQEQDQL